MSWRCHFTFRMIVFANVAGGTHSVVWYCSTVAVDSLPYSITFHSVRCPIHGTLFAKCSVYRRMRRAFTVHTVTRVQPYTVRADEHVFLLHFKIQLHVYCTMARAMSAPPRQPSAVSRQPVTSLYASQPVSAIQPPHLQSHAPPGAPHNGIRGIRDTRRAPIRPSRDRQSRRHTLTARNQTHSTAEHDRLRNRGQYHHQ